MMRFTHLSRASLAISSFAVMCAAFGATITAVTPVFSQLVAMSMPPDVHPVFENTKDDYYIHEFVKNGENEDQWSEMITLSGRKNAALTPQASAKTYVMNIFKGFQQACPQTFALEELGPQKIDGREGFAAIGSCGRVNAGQQSHSETAIILGIKGKSDMYTIQWAQRDQPSDHPLALARSTWTDRFSQLNPIRVCERGSDEIQHCAARK
jgi:hypothetical protein